MTVQQKLMGQACYVEILVKETIFFSLTFLQVVVLLFEFSLKEYLWNNDVRLRYTDWSHDRPWIILSASIHAKPCPIKGARECVHKCDEWSHQFLRHYSRRRRMCTNVDPAARNLSR